MVIQSIGRVALVLGCSVAMAAVLGCGRKHRPAHHGAPLTGAEGEPTVDGRVDEIVKWDTQLSEDMPGLVIAFVHRAEHYGCEVHRSEPDAAVATCDGVRIAMAKSSKTVSIGCRGVTLEECRALFKRVVESQGDTMGPPGSSPSTAPPPPSGPPPGGTSI